MKSKLNLLALVSIAALVSAPMAMAADAEMNPYHVPGESLDAGISPTITPSYVIHHVEGESLDAGIAAPRESVSYSVAGEKLDSGLGNVTAEEIRRIVDAYAPMKIASMK